jgi:hypothetical protein
VLILFNINSFLMVYFFQNKDRKFLDTWLIATCRQRSRV